MAKIRIIKRYPMGGFTIPEDGLVDTGLHGKYSTMDDKYNLSNDAINSGTNLLQTVAGTDSQASKTFGTISKFASTGNSILPGGAGAIGGAAAGVLWGGYEAWRAAQEQLKANKQEHMAFMDKNVSYGQDMGLNPFISALGGTIPKFALGSVEAQLDEGEMISTPEGHLYPTKSKEMHEQMGPNEKTDDLKKGSFVYSNRNGLLWKEIEQVVTIAEQQLGIKLNTQILKTYAKDKGRTTPADMAANIEKGLQRKPTPGKHGEATSKRNEQVKAMMLAEVQKYNDVLKALTEGGQEPAVPQMPQQMQQVMAKYGGYINKYDDGGLVGPNSRRRRKPREGELGPECPTGTVVVWSEDGETYQCWDPKDINKGKDGTPAPGNTPPKGENEQMPLIPDPFTGTNSPKPENGMDGDSPCIQCIGTLLTQGIGWEEAKAQCPCGNIDDDIKKNPKQGGGSPFGAMLATNAFSAFLAQGQQMYPYEQLNEQPTRDMKTKIPMDGIVNQINRGARNSAQSMPGAPWQPTMANLQAIHGQKSNQIGEVAGQVGKMNVDLFNQQKNMLQSLAGQNQLTKQAWNVDDTKLKNMKHQAPGEAAQKTMESYMDYYKSMAANEMQSAYIKAMLQQMGMDPEEMGFSSRGFSLK